LKPRLLECFQKLKLSLIDVQKRVAVWTSDALGLIGRAQLEWTAAVWATQLRSVDASFFFFRGARRGDAEIRERDLLAEEDKWRRLVVIDRSERAVRAGEICVIVSFTGREQVRNLAFRAECGCASGFRDHQLRGPGQAVHFLSELELLECRYVRAFGNRILKRDVEAALRFGEPAEPAVRERCVPLVPLPAHLVTELRASGQLKRYVFKRAAKSDVQRRSGFDKLRDLAEIFQLAIGARDCGVAVLADDDDGLAALELNRRAARRAVRHEHAHLAAPAAAS